MSESQREPAGTQFVFAGAERGGVLLGVRMPQLLAVLAALVAFVIGMSAGRLASLAGLFVAALMVGWAFVPVRGRTLQQWTPIAAGFWLRDRSGRRSFRAWPADSHRGRWPLPDTLADLEVLAAPVDGGAQIGVIVDRAADRYLAVAQVSGRGFALLDAAAQERRVQSWGSVLTGLCREGSVISRISWVERTTPDPGNAMSAHFQQTGAPEAVSAHSYRQLLATAGPVTQAHTVLLTISVDGRKSRTSRIRKSSRDEASTQALLRACGVLSERLHAAELTVTGWLSPRMLAAQLRQAYRPRAQERLQSRSQPDEGIAPGLIGPSATEEFWSYYRHDDAVSVTYWVGEWPRLPVAADVLAPLLLQTQARRAIAVVMEAVPPAVSRRRVRSAATNRQADAELRDRIGQVTTELDVSAAEADRRRAREVAAGHAEFRFSGYLTVTAESEDELNDACAQVEQAADACLLELHRLYGEQDYAFTLTLPLGRGL
jgi:hypothetical protein